MNELVNQRINEWIWIDDWTNEQNSERATE